MSKNNAYRRILTACALSMAMMTLTACQTLSTSTDYQKDESVKGGNRDEIAQVRTSLAAQYIKEGKLDAAKRQLEAAFSANSHYAPAYDMMGILLQQEGSAVNLQRADEYFRRAIGADGNFMPARNNYGVYLATLGRHQAAITQLEIAGAALGYEGRTRALENLGMSYNKVGDVAQAKQAFIRAIDTGTGSAIARIELINILLDEGNTLLAKQLYDELGVMSAGRKLPAEILLQGVRIAHLQHNQTQVQKLSQEILSLHPLSEEARRLRVWLKDRTQPLR